MRRSKKSIILKKYLGVLKYFCLFLLLIPSYVKTITYSKYVMDYVYDNYLVSNDFYFYSDILKDETFNTYDWDPEKQYILALDLRNYADTFRWTQENISYTVSVSCSPSIPGDVSCSGTNGTLVSGETGTKIRIPIILSNTNNLNFVDDDYVTMNISVNSTAPYSKGLSGSFIIHVKTTDVVQKVDDSVNNPYGELIITNEKDETKTCTISWDYSTISMNVADRNDINVTSFSNYEVSTQSSSINYVNGMTISIPKKTSYRFLFFKTDITQDYTYPSGTNSSAFTLTCN